jgi:hypothetical protein
MLDTGSLLLIWKTMEEPSPNNINGYTPAFVNGLVSTVVWTKDYCKSATSQHFLSITSLVTTLIFVNVRRSRIV